MAYNATEMGLAVKLRPRAARKELRRILREVNGSAPAAADKFGVTRRTFDRWLTELGLQETAARFRANLPSSKARQ